MKVYKYLVILLFISLCFGCRLPEDELPIEDWVVTYVGYDKTPNVVIIDAESDYLGNSDDFFADYERNIRVDFINLTSLKDREFESEDFTVVPGAISIYIRGIDPALVEGTDIEILFDTETYFYKECDSPYGAQIEAKCRFITPSVTIKYNE